MIKIFDKNKNFIQGTEDYKNIKLEEETSMTSTLSFSIPLHLKDIIEEEGYIEIKEEGSFVIKEININIESISVICKQNLEDLTSNVSNKAYVTKTMQYILSDLLQGTGWSGIADTNISRTVTGVNMSILDYIYKAIDVFKYEVKFDSVNKKVIAREKIGSDKGVYFHDEVNLKSTNISSDTYDFVTRIIPIGFDGLGIELINGGKSYVENHSYSNKIITLEWKDERYTVAENLKRDAKLKLEKLCRPLRTYSCSIEDLSKSKEYSILSYEVGDTIDLIDREKGIREKQRITKTVKYLNSEGEDSVEIANRPRIFGESTDEKIDNNFSYTNSKLELLDDKIIAEVKTVNQSISDNVTTINEKMGQLIITDNEISNIVHDLTTTVGENYTELDNKIGSLDIKADGINASVSSLNTKVDGNKTTTDSKIGALEVTAGNISTKVTRAETTANRAEGKADANIEDISLAYTLINQTSDDILLEVGKKIGANEVVSSINIQPSSVKIDTKNLDLSGNLDLRGAFTAYQNNAKAIEVRNNAIILHDWESYNSDISGYLLAARDSGLNTPSIAFAHAMRSYSAISYESTSNVFFPYITFDKRKIKGVEPEYPIYVDEPTKFRTTTKVESTLKLGQKNVSKEAEIYYSDTLDKLMLLAPVDGGFRLGDRNGRMLEWSPQATYAVSLEDTLWVKRNLKVTGHMTVDGSKSNLVTTDNYGKREITAYETAEYFYGDIGSGIINKDGECIVYIDDIFKETVNTDMNYHVFTQKYSGNINKIAKEKNYFIIYGEVGTEFSWELKAKRKGYEHTRLNINNNEDYMTPASFDYELIEANEIDEELREILENELENVLTKLLLGGEI